MTINYETKTSKIMKYYVIILLLGSSILFSCSNEKQEQVEQLQAEKLEFKSKLQAKDSALLDFMESISNIEKNLVQIREREMNIVLKNREKDPQNLIQHKKDILNDIKVIDKLILENKNRILGLNASLIKVNSENSRLKNFIDDMKSDLENKIQKQEDAIVLLKTELQAKASDIKNLTADIEILKDEKEGLVNKINEGYYLVSDFQDLKSKAVLEKDGGIFGIGASMVLEDDFSTSYFNKIDIREVSMFPIEAKKVELITSHNTDSYAIKSVDKGKSMLLISDPVKFWEKSHYLVVVTKN